VPPIALNLTGEGANSMRGYYAINNILQERLLADDAKLDLSVYFESPTAEEQIFGGSLVDLLGVYKGDGLNSSLRGAQPNALNMTLWFLTLDGLARDLTKVCETGQAGGDLKLNVAAQNALRGVCAFPEGDSMQTATLRSLWDAAMGFDAPEEEFTAWQEYVRSEEFNYMTAKEAIPQMLMAVWYSPYFLLRN